MDGMPSESRGTAHHTCLRMVWPYTPHALQHINFLTLPFEDLLQHWGFSEDKLAIVVRDPPDGPTAAHVNAGFLVFRNHPTVHKALDDWWHCPERTEGCDIYRNNDLRPDKVGWPEQEVRFATGI